MIELEIILLYTAHKVRNTISLKRMKKKVFESGSKAQSREMKRNAPKIARPDIRRS